MAIGETTPMATANKVSLDRETLISVLLSSTVRKESDRTCGPVYISPAKTTSPKLKFLVILPGSPAVESAKLELNDPLVTSHPRRADTAPQSAKFVPNEPLV
jgi:hypothetical protein